MRVTSFAYRDRGPPPNALVVDCRPLPNPHNRPVLRELDGTHAKVKQFVMAQGLTAKLLGDAFNEVVAGRADHVAFGCYGGRHRSVAMAELLAGLLKGHVPEVIVEHTSLKQ